MIDRSKWEWFGFAGHFVCGQWCRFHLCTKVGDYLVSTVGMFVHPRHGKGTEVFEYEWVRNNPNGEEIGSGRYYETMVFNAGPPCSTKGCDCGQPTAGSWTELDASCYQTAGEAQRGHYAMCEKWAAA